MDQRRPDGTSFVAPLLQELSFLLDHAESVGSQLLRVLVGLGDEIIQLRDKQRDLVEVDNRLRLGTVLEKIVRLIQADTWHRDVLSVIDWPSASVGASAYLIARLGQPHNLVWQRSSDEHDEPALSREAVLEIGQRFANRLCILATAGALQTGQLIGIVLRVWGTFGKEEEVRSWVAKSLDDPTAFVDLIFSQMAEVTSSAPPYRYRSLRGDFDSSSPLDLEEMISAAVRHLASNSIPERDRPDVERFLHEARRLLEKRAERGGGGISN